MKPEISYANQFDFNVFNSINPSSKHTTKPLTESVVRMHIATKITLQKKNKKMCLILPPLPPRHKKTVSSIIKNE